MINNKLKILYLITQSEFGGAQRYILDLAKELRNEYEIIVAFGEQGHEGELAKRLKAAHVVSYHLPHLKRAISPCQDLLALWEIIKLIRGLKPNIVHLNSSKISILGSLAYLFIRIIIRMCPIRSGAAEGKTQISIVYTIHGWVFNEPLPAKKKKFYLIAERFTARFKHKLICVSEFDRQLALKEKIAPPEKLTAIHNGLPPVNFLPPDQAYKKLLSIAPLLRIAPSPYQGEGRGEVGPGDEVDWSKSEIRIASIGNLYPTKGFEYLIQAIKILSDNNFNIQAFIIGEGRERKELENIIAQFGLKKNVILTGQISNAAQLLKAFDIYVCSSVKEGLSYTLIEAMQAGLPIVATRVGGNPELITGQKQGLLAPRQNPQALAQAMVKLINDHNLARQLGLAARQKALSEFSLTRMITKTKSVYQELN